MASASAGIGSALPSQAGVTSGFILQTDGTTATWVSASSGSGITALTGDVTASGSGSVAATITNAVKSVAAVGSTPSANGASIATTVLTLQPADATHPGLVSTGAQTFGGNKTIGSWLFNPAGGFGGGTISVGGVFIGCDASNAGVTFGTTTGAAVGFWVGSGTVASLSNISLDLTGLGSGGSIKLKSANGTTFTLTVSNAGALVIT